MNALTPTTASPFHKGEQEAQARAGTRERTEMIGQRAIRSYMPDQHRVFFEQIPFVVVGSVDPEGWPWVSILTGGSGFITSREPTALAINAKPVNHDPLAASLKQGAALGVLGIELETRRRNRVNARIKQTTSAGVELEVVQSFGNCPQYIQTRDLHFIHDPQVPRALQADHFEHFNDVARDFIVSTDTFFVSSYVANNMGFAAESVDVSHRGGVPGFVKVDGDTLTIPDFAGNNFFNTIGNFLVTPKAGLLFPDFTTGDLLSLTGTVEMLWDDHPEVRSFVGAERAWRFRLHHGVRLRDALPFRTKLQEYSPASIRAGNWSEAQA